VSGTAAGRDLARSARRRRGDWTLRWSRDRITGEEVSLARVRHGKSLGCWYRLAVALLRVPLLVLTKRDWRGARNLQAEVRPDGTQQGVIVCPNHISWFDPLQCAHFLYDNGRPPRFLAKEAVFRVPVVGRIIAGAGQIPVYRDTVDAARSVRDAVEAVRRGECVVVYPEGTITRDPEMWPMTGKTGAARIALATGAPLLPMGMWGAQEVMAPYRRQLRLIPRKTLHVIVGEPIDLSDLVGRPIDMATLRIATDRLMAAVTALVEALREQPAPVTRFDWRRGGASGDEHGGEPARKEGTS
jgi:1-acyl-sn-glycerol-3-phosphate acyltransferase